MERSKDEKTLGAVKAADQKASKSIGSRWLRVASKLAFVRQDVLVALLVRGATRKRSKGSRVVQDED